MGSKITMNGKPYKSGDFGKALEEDILKKAREHVRKQIEAKLDAVHCPDHVKAATVRVDIANLKAGKGKIIAKPCCEKVADQVAAIMNGIND